MMSIRGEGFSLRLPCVDRRLRVEQRDTRDISRRMRRMPVSEE